jgi:drug/metabolite transporter (DMT)-like permease
MSSGLAQMALAAFYFSLMGLMVRFVAHLPLMEVVFFRALVSVALSAWVLTRQRSSWWGKNPKLLFARGCTGFLGLTIYLYTIQTLSLAEAVTLQYLNPIFSTLFAPWILKERSLRMDKWALGIAFLGVVLIANPEASGRWFVAGLGVCGAALSGVSYNWVRKLGLQGEDPYVIVLYFPLVSLVFAMPFVSQVWVSPVGNEWLWLLGIGMTTQLGQVALSRGLARERISKATLVNYLVIFLSTFFSILIGDPIQPLSYLGMGLILASLAMTTLSHQKKGG